MSLSPNNPYLSQGVRPSGDQGFADPFNDLATQQMPTTMRTALWWSEHIWMRMGTYRMAMERIVSYFITEVELGGDAGDDEKNKYKDYLKKDLDVLSFLGLMMRDRLCFHGDVKTTTRDGVFKLRDLAGKTVEVLSKDGIYRPAEFKSFGRQELLEVEFSDGRTILATPDHEWPVLNCSGKEVTLPTKSLIKGHKLKRTVAPRPEKNDDYREGIRHGFVFGDGSLYNQDESRTTMAAAYFYGDKDQEMLKHFEGHSANEPKVHEGRTILYGLPATYKSLPENSASASYWYGFLCGFLAADGTVDTYGCAMLTQISKATLEAIEEQLPRIGMCAGPIRAQERITDLSAYGNYSDGGIYESTIHFMTLLKQFMQPEDILLSKHREKFEENWNPDSNYGKYIGIRGVTETGIVDEVFCCVEMETHTFVVDQAVLTSNCYGNAFASLLVPFRRFLMCPKTGDLFPLKVVYDNFNFEFNGDFEFIATCPTTGWRGPWKLIDKPREEADHVILKRWSPHEIELLPDLYTGEVAYLWRIPEDYKRMIREGNLFHLERASKQVLEAIKYDKLFRFHKDAIYHMKEQTLAGIRNMGWGLPRSLVNFRQIWYVQVLRRYNEAIAMDYVIPFRLITPEARSGGSVGGMPTQDPMSIYSGGDFRAQVRHMINKRRRDPAAWQTLPFPVQYQMLGGDASQLAPTELITQGLDTLLNESGVPVEFYNGNLSTQAAPAALRLFESTHRQLVSDANHALQWICETLSRVMSWERVDASLKRVTIADDVQKQMAALQLMMAQRLSGTSGLGALGFDWESEQQSLAEEARIEQEIAARNQEEMEQAGFAAEIAKGINPATQGQAAAGGGDPAAGGAAGGAAAGGNLPGPDAQSAMGAGNMPVTEYIQSMGPNSLITPGELQSAAQSLAQQLLGLPEGVKDSQLRELKQSHPVLHSATRSAMDDIRQQVRSQAGGAAMQQMQSGSLM